MVEFTNITFDKDWIYAHAHDLDGNFECDIKIKRHEEVFEPLGDKYSLCHKAALNMRREVNKGNIKQNGVITITWG